MARIIDLTVELYHGLETWMIHPPVVVIDYHQQWLNKDRYQAPCQGFATKMLMFTDHIGTHVDAPRHFFPDEPSIEQMPVDQLIGDAVLLDVSFRSLDGPVTSEHLEQCVKSKNIEIRPGDIMLLRAWPGPWGTKEFAVTRGLTDDAVNWVLAKQPKVIATDLATLDDMEDWTRPAHVKPLRQHVAIIENLINLDQIPSPRFKFMALPLKIKGGTGSPIRAIALVDD